MDTHTDGYTDRSAYRVTQLKSWRLKMNKRLWKSESIFVLDIFLSCLYLSVPSGVYKTNNINNGIYLYTYSKFCENRIKTVIMTVLPFWYAHVTAVTLLIMQISQNLKAHN